MSLKTAPIKAIETNYKGYRFRSRLEARYAVFFDTCREEWEYEKEGYELPSGWYLPDFWLPRMNCWFEVKGQLPTVPELNLARELADATGEPCVVSYGLPGQDGMFFYCWEVNDGSGGSFSGRCEFAVRSESEDRELYFLTSDTLEVHFRANGDIDRFRSRDRDRDYYRKWMTEPWNAIVDFRTNWFGPYDSPHREADKAKAARFEFNR